MSATRDTGLSIISLSVILLASLAVFLFWDGALWAAHEGTSHAGRIFISYAVVIPFAAAALAIEKRWSLVHLATSTGLLWAVKLILTSTLYLVLAPTTTRNYQPALSWNEQDKTTSADRASHRYQPAELASSGAIKGRVLSHGAPLAGALISVLNPGAGAPLGPSRAVALEISGARYARSVYGLSTHDTLSVHNRDGQLHTLIISREGSARANWPIPASSEPRTIPVPSEPGLYTLRCGSHPSEEATVALFDHPYFTLSDENGRFELAALPLGETTIAVRAPGGHEHQETFTVAKEPLSLPAIEVSEDQG